MTPAQRAITVAAFVVTVALGLYAVAAVVDRWPELVIASWGAALGAGVAVNGIALREIDLVAGDATGTLQAHRIAAVRHQIAVVLVALSAWLTADHAHVGWALATVGFALAWAWTLPPLAAALERASAPACLRAYYVSFRVFAVAGAIGLMYASVAVEALWLWRPTTPADLQAFVWLGILEFAGLPLTLIALAAEH